MHSKADMLILIGRLHTSHQGPSATGFHRGMLFQSSRRNPDDVLPPCKMFRLSQPR